MIRPESLLCSMKDNFGKYFLIIVVRSKTLMVFGMPVLGSYHQIKITLNLVNYRYYQITLRHFQWTSWHKILLGINDNKCFHLKLLFKFINESVAFIFKVSAYSNFINMRVVKPFIFFRKFFK